MKIYNAILIIALIIPIVSIGTFFLWNEYSVEEVHTIEAHIQVGSYFGLTRNNDKLYLGTIKPPGTAFRNFTVSNNADTTRKIEIKIIGSHEDFFSIRPDTFILGPHQNQSVMYYATIDSSVPHGNYSSNVSIYYLKYSKLFK